MHSKKPGATKMGMCMKLSCGVSVVVSLAMIIVGVTVLVAVLPKVLRTKLEESLPVKEGTDSATRFIESPVPGFMSFYVFNVTNMDAVNEKGEKPELQELGPYVYEQKKVKTDLKWDAKLGNRTSGLVSYQEVTHYTFDASRSKGTEEDIVNHLSVMSVFVMSNGKNFQFNTSTLASELIVNHTVGDLLFNGFDVKPYFPPTLHLLVCTALGKLCNFSFYMENPSTSKLTVVETGVSGLDDIGKIRAYGGSNLLKYWHNDYCNALNGTDGKQFAPGVTKDDGLYVFSSDICRSLKLQYDSDVVVQQIDALRFTVPQDVFSNPNVNKDNMCFCQKSEETKPCPSKAGVFSVEKCKSEPFMGMATIPIAMSAPHFYYGEKEYVERFKGLNPTKSKHQTTVDVEPLTGTTISAAKRIQVNFIVAPGNAPFQKFVKDTHYFPVMWVEEGAEIDEKSAADFRKLVTNPYKTGKWAMVAIIAVGGVALLFMVVIACFRRS